MMEAFEAEMECESVCNNVLKSQDKLTVDQINQLYDLGRKDPLYPTSNYHFFFERTGNVDELIAILEKTAIVYNCAFEPIIELHLS